jgi:hypothetical protein
MTSLRQLDANRRNALKSTGPQTENGKVQSRRNALKHGLTAETVIEPLENAGQSRAFRGSDRLGVPAAPATAGLTLGYDNNMDTIKLVILAEQTQTNLPQRKKNAKSKGIGRSPCRRNLSARASALSRGSFARRSGMGSSPCACSGFLRWLHGPYHGVGSPPGLNA